jgi:hypothetical protein
LSREASAATFPATRMRRTGASAVRRRQATRGESLTEDRRRRVAQEGRARRARAATREERV